MKNNLSNQINDLSASFLIARKSITRGGKSTLFLLILVLSLSFFEMMVITGIISGVYQEMINSAKNLLSSDIIISPRTQPQIKEFIDEQTKVRAQIETIPGVVATARHYITAGAVSFDKGKNGKFKTVSGLVVGIDPEEEKRVLTTTSRLLIDGKSLDAADTDQVLIGSAMAGGYKAKTSDDLGGVKIGDKVRLAYSNGVAKVYTVKGIYDDTMRSGQIFITANEAESVFSVYDSASQIMVKTDSISRSDDLYVAKIKSMFPELKVQDYNIFLGQLTDFLAAINMISVILSVISILVAAIVIFVIIYVNALNKRRQIGILKAIGIKQSIIINAYIMQSLFYTFSGVIIGLTLVFGIAVPFLEAHPLVLVANLANLTLYYTPVKIAVAISSFFVAGYLAGRIPAWMVAKQDIIKAIWG